ncbi:phage tail protein [Vibrio sp. RE86]|uniref:phage tail-collar fiber domain-containing protein n=1 Tax=Vibrio sp. RE86 TaxID=2607605 RepID=UPI0020A4F9FC|nr:phage tail protein [Vibrio sp. RE86]
MSQTAIPLEFERYLQNQISVGDAPDMNEMIFAHIPGLDPSQPINRENGLPDVSLWVHQQDIDQVGKLGDNALAYSVVIPGTVAEFTFNAIYLRDKNVPNSCGMVVHKAEETKENGMASTKSLVQAYDGAAQIAGITVDASTWQIDYQARLKGIEEDHRLACLDNYGHTAFVDGFDVTQQADPNKYKVTPGVVYVGGLRGVLAQEVIQTIATKPNGLYVDIVRQGTALSVWENKVTIAVSETELTDYVDGNDEQHYVAKLAGINADGSVVDWREKGGLAEHVADSDPHAQYLKESEYNQDKAAQEASLVKLPHYPEIMTVNNQLDISLVGTTITVADNQVVRLYGWKDFNTTDLQTKSFEIDLAKTYHLRFTEDHALELKDLSDVGYNPTSKAETDPSFDSAYDDMLLAKIETGTLTPLINKHELHAEMQMVGMNTNPVHPARIFTYNWARTPFQVEGLIIGMNAHSMTAFEDWNNSFRERVSAFDVLLVNLNRYTVHHKYRALDDNVNWEGGQLGVRFKQEVRA